MALNNEGQANSVDVAVGRQLRILRQARSITISDLAEQVGVTHQQIQKYEVGQNRIAAGRLFELALALEVPVSTFFESIERGRKDQPGLDEAGDLRGLVVADRFGRLPESQKLVVLSLVESMVEGDVNSNGPDGGA